MKLNDRKIKILEAIITDYVATAEPVGSRTIAKKYDLGISPATIRNEMSDLEEMGLIEQPHTSAGRIPSQMGYRMYVDNMMHKRVLTSEEVEFLKNAISLNVDRIEYLMQQTAKALSMLTNYTTIVTEPKSTRVKIKHIQLVPIDNNTVAAVVVTDSKAIKNHIIKAKAIPDISQKMLTTQLKELEHSGIIKRIIINDNPPKTIVYKLSEEQSELIGIMDTLCSYTKKYAKNKSIMVAD